MKNKSLSPRYHIQDDDIMKTTWRLDGNAGNFGRRGSLQDILSLSFISGGRAVSGTENGDMCVVWIRVASRSRLGPFLAPRVIAAHPTTLCEFRFADTSGSSPALTVGIPNMITRATR